MSGRPSIVLVLLGALFIIVGMAANGVPAGALAIAGVVLAAVFVAGWIRYLTQRNESGPRT
jgi:hypothetical protein